MRKINRVFVCIEIVLTAMFFCTGMYGLKVGDYMYVTETNKLMNYSLAISVWDAFMIDYILVIGVCVMHLIGAIIYKIYTALKIVSKKSSCKVM